jgi:hypothetical protein
MRVSKPLTITTHIVPDNYVDNIPGEKVAKSHDFRASFLTGLSTRSAKRLTFVTIEGAGHMASFFSLQGGLEWWF